MSTILDALRKVEQDHRAQNTDVRARLLTPPPRPHAYATQKKLPSWIMSLGLAMIGFLIGAGVIMYRPSPILTSTTAVSTSSLPSGQTGKAVLSTSQDKPAAAPAADTPPAQPSAEPPTDPFVPISASQEQSAPALANMQRSPFTSTPSSASSKSAYAARPVTAATSLMTSQDEYIIEPLPQDLWGDESEALSPEDEGHFLPPSWESIARRAPVISPTSVTPRVPLDASLSLLQWSPEAAERFASIKIGDGPLTMVYEGDSVGGFTIVEIHKNKVDLRSDEADRANRTLHLR